MIHTIALDEESDEILDLVVVLILIVLDQMRIVMTILIGILISRCLSVKIMYSRN